MKIDPRLQTYIVALVVMGLFVTKDFVKTRKEKYDWLNWNDIRILHLLSFAVLLALVVETWSPTPMIAKDVIATLVACWIFLLAARYIWTKCKKH